MLVAVVCTVLVFALVSKADKGKQPLPTRHVHKRLKTTLPGQTGIIGHFAGGSVTHANTAHVEVPLPYSARKRTKDIGPEFISKYVGTHPWLRWGLHPLVASCVQDEGLPTPDKSTVLCRLCRER